MKEKSEACSEEMLSSVKCAARELETLTGAPGFPGTDRGGMLGLLPGGAGAAAGVGAGSGAAGAATAGAAFGTGDVFSRFSASLFERKRQILDVKEH